MGNRKQLCRMGGAMLKVNELFKSLDGETNQFYQGRQTIFIRLADCNLDCFYCDTKYAKDTVASYNMDLTQILLKLDRTSNIKNVTITGGEPLIQKEELFDLIKLLDANNYNVSIETNGSIAIPIVPFSDRISFVIDYKLPSSAMQKHMHIDTFYLAREWDWIKFVIAHKQDYDMAKKMMANIRFRNPSSRFIMSPVFYGSLETTFRKARELEERIIVDDLDVIFNFQIHKFLWNQDEKEGNQIQL